MSALRRLFSRHYRLFGCFIALSLAMKLVVSSGFMPVFTANSFTIQLCDGYGAPIAMAAETADDGAHHAPAKTHADKTHAVCAFASLSAPALAAMDLTLLVAALVFIMVQGVRPTAPPFVAIWRFFRPPLRAPPAYM